MVSLFGYGRRATAEDSPYPRSKVFSGIEWDFASRKKLAIGSDIWGITWADDGHQYAVWGDGGGFRGTNSRCRVSGTGIARIEGASDNYNGLNRHGIKNCCCPSECKWNGLKHWAFNLVCVKGIFYKFTNRISVNRP